MKIFHGRMHFKELPTGDGLWFIKWIDEFRTPHKGTRSPSVSVLIQRLSNIDAGQLHKLTPQEISKILASRPEEGGIDKVQTLVGNIPFYAIGKVFQNGQQVGELPARQDRIVLYGTNAPNYRIEEISSNLEAPAGWNPEFKYHPLNRSEYPELFSRGFAKSQCLICDRGEIQFIIPLTVLFKSFYGLTKQMANAFCKAPWPESQRELVHLEPMESGLWTRDNRELHTWDVVLQPKINRNYARILAAFLFDPHAMKHAELIYSASLRNRGNFKDAAWMCDARIPFDTGREALRLRTKGYQLRKSWSKGPEKILVSAILGASFPSYFPPVRWEKRNSGETGTSIEYLDKPAPYLGGGSDRPMEADTIVDSDIDPEVEQGSASALADDFLWDNYPPLLKMTKEHSNRYLGESHNQKPSGGTDRVSGGTQTHQGGGATEADTQTIIRDPGNRLIHLMNAFEGLRAIFEENGHNFVFSILGPLNPSYRIVCGGWPCWNFLDDDSRQTGKWPSRSWRLIESKSTEHPFCQGIPRSALVLEIELDGNVGYWLEIETRTTGNEHYLSPFFRTTENPIDVIETVVEAVAQAKGVNLEKELQPVAISIGRTEVRCYKHQYQGDSDSSLDLASIYRFLARRLLL